MIKQTILTITFFCFACLCSKTSRAGDDRDFYEDRLSQLVHTKDTFLAYYRDCSCCIKGIEGSAFFLYKEKRHYIFEYYRWTKEGKIISRFRTKKKSGEARNIFGYIAANYDSLSKYQGRIALTYPVTITDISDSTHQQIFTLQQEFNQGPYANYLIKFSDSLIRTSLAGSNDISYYGSRARPVGALLLVLNTFYYQRSFDKLTDN